MNFGAHIEMLFILTHSLQKLENGTNLKNSENFKLKK